MKKISYNYSKQLIQPEGIINCNRNNPIIAWREKKNIAKNKEEVKKYFPPKGVIKEKKKYQSYDYKEVTFYILKRDTLSDNPVPCIIYYHGGGFMMPLQTMMFQNATYYVLQTGCQVILPEYRYAPEVPCRTTIEDCFYMVIHIRKNYKKYGINPKEIIIYGESAGGALAAGITHLMRDRKIPAAAGQMLIYPATDYHSEKYKSMEEYKYAVWPKSSNLFMWKQYLKGASNKTVNYAAPMNIRNFKNLPLAYVEPQEMDAIRDEGIAYAKKLEKAGSLLELKVIPQSYHGFDFDHTSPLVQKVLKHRCEIIKYLCEKNK